MRSTPHTRVWRVRWHQWWRDAHGHAAQYAEDDVFRHISWPDDEAEWNYPNHESYGEVARLRAVARRERDKEREHSVKMWHLLLDKDGYSR